jgi:hypothetical protein
MYIRRKKIKLEPEPEEGDCTAVGEASVKEDPEAHVRSRAVGRLPNSLLYPGTMALAQVLKLFITYMSPGISISKLRVGLLGVWTLFVL